ncbi:MAG: LptF/LptG family permease, partial [Phycisphaerales bacterium]|nr:LptF/LptG family permease [Phycisphaerales bacterium]
MPARPPLILWRHLAFELARILCLATAALVVIISFAATIKPLADGEIGLLDAFKLMGLMVVPMLQFALPFAAGLAATLTYHRFAADNEAI